jgi:thiamine-phosphate pyrophosphorylase
VNTESGALSARGMPIDSTPSPRLIFVTDSAHYGWATTQACAERVCALARPGTLAVLLREPSTSVREVAEQARALRELTSKAGQLLLVRDRLDLALWVNADGLHLTEQSVAAKDLHAIPPGEGRRPLWLTRAWHDVEQTPDPDAHALLIAPVAAARKGRAALGSAGLQRAVSNAAGRPVYALGGIDADHVSWVLASGAAGIAAISAVHGDPGTLIANLNALRS